MTNEEAIKRIVDHMTIHKMNEPRAIKISMALQMAIEALEKQTPKKPDEDWCKSLFSDDANCFFRHLICPNCGKMEVNQIDDFCPLCGQAIDWSDE